MKQLLSEDGTIDEPSSFRFGMKPHPDKKRERRLLIRRWFWLIIPIAGFIGFATDSTELVDKYGYRPWWV